MAFRFPLWQASFGRITIGLVIGLLMVYGVTLVVIGGQFRGQIRDQMISRDSELIYAVTQLASRRQPVISGLGRDFVGLALESSELKGVLGITIYDAGGLPVESVPLDVRSEPMQTEDWIAMQALEVVDRFHSERSFATIFEGLEDSSVAPITEIIIPLTESDGVTLEAAIQLWIDGSSLSEEYASLDQNLWWQGSVAFVVGGGLLTGVVLLGALRMRSLGNELASRTIELERKNSELTLAAKSSAVGAISAHLVHGLKNPLSGLQRYLETQPDGDEAAAVAHRMQALLREVTGMMRQTQATRQINCSVEEIIEMLRVNLDPVANEAGVEMIWPTENEDGWPELPGHQANLTCLIVTNLISNAIEASPRGSRVDLAVLRTNDQFGFQVSDRGTGFPEHLKEQIFSPVVSTKPDGSGLGLAISFQLARQLEAELSLESSGPKGSRFQLLMKVPALSIIDLNS